jgi:hypothetical protein
MVNNVLFVVFQMMTVQVRIPVIQQQVKKSVHRDGMEANVLFEIHHPHVYHQVKLNNYNRKKNLIGIQRINMS